MGADLRKLVLISKHVELRKYIKTIWIEDDCEKNDPWYTAKPPEQSDIWPRDDAGFIIATKIGVRELRHMLSEKWLCPATIILRDYRIALHNLGLFPDFTEDRNCRIGTTLEANPERAPALAKDIIDGLDLALVSLSVRIVVPPLSDNSLIHLPSNNLSLNQPQVTEVSIDLSPQHQGHGMGLSLLHSVELRAAPYWLEQSLYHAPNLENIKLHSSWDAMLYAGNPIPKLKKVELTAGTLHAHTILTLLANSKHSLHCIHLRMITLSHGSSWRELLVNLGDSLTELTSFQLSFPRGEGDEARSLRDSISFIGFGPDDVPEACRAGLTLKEKGPAHMRRLTWVLYEGPSAGLVLKSLAAYTSWYHHIRGHTPYESSGTN